MAKQTKEKPSNTRVPKGKSPRQLAKKEANIKRYNERCARLKAEAQQKAEVRKAQTVARIVQLVNVKDQAAYEAAYVQAALYGPVGVKVKSYIGWKPATYEKVRQFFAERPYLPQPLAEDNKAA